jgi:hypothetical protein
MTDDEKHLKTVQRHISLVQQNCQKLGEALLEQNEANFDFVRRLLANAQVHDNSKFYGAEWLYLRDDVKKEKPDLFMASLQAHWARNEHHPEHWDSIHEVPRIFLCEMVADWKARSDEFGTDLRSWIEDSAAKKYNFNKRQKVWKEIRLFLNLLLEDQFK